MTSDKKVKANRSNALKSTGPKTPEGKAAVRLNALRHGILSREILLPGEDEQALRELSEHLRDELQPVGELESLLVDRIISAYWRLRRLGRVETGIFAWERSEELAERAEREAQEYESNEHEDLMRVMSITVTDKKGHEEALSRARRMRSEQEDETAIERTLYRALHELERRQAARRGADLTPPQVLDVEVSGMPEVTGS